jgi:predicted solute-binding protein
MSKNVQVPQSLLNGIWLLLKDLEGIPLPTSTKTIVRHLEREVEQKFQAMERRAVFTAYKTAEKGSDEREKMRQKYLDDVGIHKDWRSSREVEF